jgi:cardiolipin synthase (CMP-forming)
MASAMPHASPSPWRHLPNAISLSRVLLVAPIAWCLLQRHWSIALFLISMAGMSDGLDGFLARRYGWQSRLGGMLDAIADKLLLVSCFLILAWLGEVPWWLAMIVFSRDLLIASGAFGWRVLIGPIQPQPSFLSKACTFMQIIYLLVVLLALARGSALSSVLSGDLVAALCVASAVDYSLRWSCRAWRTRRVH